MSRPPRCPTPSSTLWTLCTGIGGALCSPWTPWWRSWCSGCHRWRCCRIPSWCSPPITAIIWVGSGQRGVLARVLASLPLASSCHQIGCPLAIFVSVESPGLTSAGVSVAYGALCLEQYESNFCTGRPGCTSFNKVP